MQPFTPGHFPLTATKRYTHVTENLAGDAMTSMGRVSRDTSRTCTTATRLRLIRVPALIHEVAVRVASFPPGLAAG